MNTTNIIIPNIWFNTDGGNISKIIEYYGNIFGKDFREGKIIPLGNTPIGRTYE